MKYEILNEGSCFCSARLYIYEYCVEASKTDLWKTSLSQLGADCLTQVPTSMLSTALHWPPTSAVISHEQSLKHTDLYCERALYIAQLFYAALRSNIVSKTKKIFQNFQLLLIATLKRLSFVRHYNSEQKQTKDLESLDSWLANNGTCSLDCE